MFCYSSLSLYLKTAICLIVSVASKPISEDENSSLQLLHILFRHGDRTNSRYTIYPKDPYVNETYRPYGIGELTNKGKKRAYELGKALRERYDNFLGKSYHPDVLEAWSSNTNRTKVSLMLVLSALFPPTPEEILEDGLTWQPIPFNQHSRKDDKTFLGMFSCPNYRSNYEKYVTSDKMVEKFKGHAELFRYVSENTGWNITNYNNLFRLFLGLQVEEEWGLELPAWAKKVYPQPLLNIAVAEYLISAATTPLRTLASGYLLKKVIDDTKSKISNEAYMAQRKLMLYSGHEINIAHLLVTLDLFDPPHIPPYAAYLILEVHKVNEVYGIKIFYQNYATPSGPQLLKLAGCEKFCEFDKFVSLIEEYLPNSTSCGNESICNVNLI